MVLVWYMNSHMMGQTIACTHNKKVGHEKNNSMNKQAQETG